MSASQVERDPTKRKVKPALCEAQALFDFDDLGESSDDSDFRIEDHCDESDDDSIDTEDGGGRDESDNDSKDTDDELGSPNDKSGTTVGDVLARALQLKQFDFSESVKVLICCVCLGDRSDALNEIVDCDGCGVTVHEGCYGVSDTDSISSSVSSCSMMPWFCEACCAGVDNPICELCPNTGGIFKETDVGSWVHLTCALYIPGVAFAEVERLASVTLFEMAYSKWGAKTCQLCPDQSLARTGVAVGCDAGMCRTYFHVTCGQREGLLAEAHSEEVDQADPFYAHCKLHSDKTLMRKRRRNWLALQLRMEQRRKQHAEMKERSPEQLRIDRKLSKHRMKYAAAKKLHSAPWVPTQKMARLLTSSASACRILWQKARLSGVDTEAWELREAQVAALADVHRKWHIPPAFSVEFIGYYLDRNVRVSSMKRQLEELLDTNLKLVEEQQSLQTKYNEALKENSKECVQNQTLKETIGPYHAVIQYVAPHKALPNIHSSRNTLTPQASHPLATSGGGVPTAAALKAGVGFPLRAATSALNNACGICNGVNEQHLLAKCDTCRLHYHLGCLNPPLSRMPKKTKLMGWQCSECDKDTSGSEIECLDTEAPRRLRHPKDNGDTPTLEKPEVNVATTNLELQMPTRELAVSADNGGMGREGVRSGKKRRREKHQHHRYSPEPQGSSQGVGRSHKRKRKKRYDEGVAAAALTVAPSSEPETPRQPLKIFKAAPPELPHLSVPVHQLPSDPSGARHVHYSERISLMGRAYSDLFTKKNSFKSIPGATGEGNISYQVATASSAPTTPALPSATLAATTLTIASPARRSLPIAATPNVTLTCDTCHGIGQSSNLVSCDECNKGFHFACLDPPVKKSPKVRGYSWHCADCDPTESDTD